MGIRKFVNLRKIYLRFLYVVDSMNLILGLITSFFGCNFLALFSLCCCLFCIVTFSSIYSELTKEARHIKCPSRLFSAEKSNSGTAT